MKKERVLLWMMCLLFFVIGTAEAQEFPSGYVGPPVEDENYPISIQSDADTATLFDGTGWYLRRWISGESMGTTRAEEVRIGGTIYLNYEIVDEYGNEANPADSGYDYSVTLTVSNPDGSQRAATTFYNSSRNQLKVTYASGSATGLQSGNVKVDGELYCSSDLSWILYDAMPTCSTYGHNSPAKVGERGYVAVYPTGDNLSYQWYEASSATDEGEMIPGATSSQYSFTAAAEHSGKYYYCKISNYGNSIDSPRIKFETRVDAYFYDGSTYVTSRYLTNGQRYGTLPEAPVHYDSIFEGWYTAESGGTKIEEDNIVYLSQSQYLYAHYAPNFLASGKCGLSVSYTLTHDGVLTVSGTGSTYDYSDSSKVPWYYYQSRITQLSIERGVTRIGNHVFGDLSALSSVNIPEGVTEIGEFSFEGSQISALILPDSLVTIGQGAFSSCSALAEIAFPQNLVTIGAEAFASCSALVNLDIPGNVKTLGSGAFRNCAGLTTVVLPDGLSGVAASLFERCDALTDVTMPESVTSVGEKAFYGCLSLQNVFYDGKLEQWDGISIGGNNQPLLDADITFTRILASGQCGEQVSWTLTEGGDLIISGSGPMKDYFIKTTYLQGAFSDGGEFASLQSISGIYAASSPMGFDPLGLYTVGSSMRDLDAESDTPWYDYHDRVKRVSIEPNITKIGECSFYDCHYLEKVVIPDSVLEIGANAFFNCCYSLKSISLPSGLRSLGAGVFQWCQQLQSITIPNGVSAIPDSLFYHCDALESVTIPNSVSKIGMYAFEECASLTQLTIPSGVTEIGGCAFYKCDALTSIDVQSGNSVYSSSDGVLFDAAKTMLLQFPAASSITDYTIPAGVESVGYCAFYRAGNLTRVSIPNTVTTLAEGAFSECGQLDNVVLPASVTKTGKNVFAHCKALRCLRVPDGMNIIEDGVFDSCEALKEIVIPSSVKLIGDNAFASNDSLADVYYLGTESQWGALSVGDGNANLQSAAKHYAAADAGYFYNGDSAFRWILDAQGTLTVSGSGEMPDYSTASSYSYNPPPWYEKRDAIRTIRVSEGITVVGRESFRTCDNLVKVILPRSLTAILDDAFEYSKMTTVCFAAGVTKINYDGFYQCTNLTNVYYDGTSADWANITFGSYNSSLTNATRHYLRIVVSFNPNGGTVDPASKIVAIGDDDYNFVDTPVGDLPTPTYSGYRFDGWYTAQNGGTSVTPDTVLTQNTTLYAHWTPRYEITLDPNGDGTTVNPSKITRSQGEPYGELPTPQYNDWYKFLGWYTEKNGGTQVNKDSSVTSGNPLYAHWQYLGVTVQFNANGGTVTPATKEAIIGKPYGELPTPDHGEKYQFPGWYTAQDGGEQVTKDSVVDESLVKYGKNILYIPLYTHWIPLGVTITFDANGGTVTPSSQEGIIGKPYGELPTAVKENYQFLGWYTAKDGGTQVTKDSTVSQSVTLYAHWEYLGVTITFDANGGTVTPSSREGIIGKSYGELPTPDRGEKYKFLGWYTTKDGGTQVTKDSTVPQSVTLYAHWEYLGVTIYFDANGGTVTPSSREGIIGKPYGELPTPEYSGYEFIGWYTEPKNGTEITEDSVVNENLVKQGAVTLYAHWEYLGVTITFDANGGTVTPSSQEGIIGEPYGELPTPEYSGYEFIGWYTEPKNGTEITEDSVVNESLVKQGAVTLYAHWKTPLDILMTVDFDYNGGTGDTYSKKVTYGKPYGTLPVANKEGYLFDYWYLKNDDGNETPVTEQSIVEKTVNHYLYAHYSKPPVAVRFALNGGTRGVGIGRKNLTYGDYYGSLSTELSWEHHSFTGWFTEPDGGLQITPTTRVGQPQAKQDEQGEWAVLLYAHWADNPKVTLNPMGGTMDACTNREVEYGKPFGDFLDYFIPKKDGSQFRGWYTGELGGKRVTPVTLVESYGEFTLYAHWRSLYQTVIFNPNDNGSVETPTKEVKNGNYYGALPSLVAKDANSVLDGWYTKPGAEDKGDKISASTLIDLDGTQTLYAHVKPKDKFTVTFDLNGVQATVSPQSISVENGKTYGASGDLPVPKGTSRNFLGWYTGQQGGQQVTEQTVVQLGNHQTLYAHWGADPNGKFTVTLIPGDGASVNPKTMQAENGKAYGAMPTPTKSGFSFVGWYTDKDAGTLVSSATICRAQDHHTLYAHWRELSDFKPERDGYSMGNTADAFQYQSRGPGEDYPIPYSSFKLIFGDAVPGKTKYRSMIQGTWGGNCNGMASTAALLFAYGYIKPGDFGKDCTYALSITDTSDKIAPVPDNKNTVKTFIEAMQIAQYTEPFSKDYKQNRVYQSQLDGDGSLNALFDAVDDAYKRGRGTIIGVGNSEQHAAHALMAYKTEKTAGALYIYVYDCNYPGEVRSIKLSQNAQGQIKNWSYEIGGSFKTWESGKGSGCYISYIPFETIEDIWANRGNLYDNHVMLTVNSENLSIVTGFGEEKVEVAKLENGMLTHASEGVYDIPELSLTLAGKPSDTSRGISLYLPVDEYTLSSEDDGELQATLTDNYLCATVSTTASEVIMAVEDESLTNSVIIPSASEEDTFSVSLENGYDWVRNSSVDVSGKGDGNQISIQANRGSQLNILGTSNIDSVLINGIEVPVPELFSDVALDKANGVLSVTLNNSEGGTVMALAYDEAKDAEFIGSAMLDVDAYAGKRELTFTDTQFPETCKIKLVLLKEWPSWRVLGSYEQNF